jgi:surface antigen
MKRLVIVLFMCLFASATSALNLGFLKNSVLSRFTEAEMTEFRALVSDSMASAKDGTVVEWRSESGKISARVLFRATYINNASTTCRRVLFKIGEAERAPERYRFDFCDNESQWHYSQTSVSSFTTEDWSYLHAVAIDALDNESDGSHVSWAYRKTGNSGVVIPLSTAEINGLTCRETAFSIINRSGQTFDGKYTLCKQESGDWKLIDR